MDLHGTIIMHQKQLLSEQQTLQGELETLCKSRQIYTAINRVYETGGVKDEETQSALVNKNAEIAAIKERLISIQGKLVAVGSYIDHISRSGPLIEERKIIESSAPME